jgi:hypothetical protein
MSFIHKDPYRVFQKMKNGRSVLLQVQEKRNDYWIIDYWILFYFQFSVIKHMANLLAIISQFSPIYSNLY